MWAFFVKKQRTRLINGGDPGPTPINLGGNCTCLRQAAIHRIPPYGEGNSGTRTMIETDWFQASWICVLVRQFILHQIANLMKDSSSQQVLKYNEGLNSCLNIIFAMLSKGKGIPVFHSLCSSVLQANHAISMPKHTADKPTVLQSWKSKFLS